MTSFFNEELHSSDSDDDDYVPNVGEVSSDEDAENPMPSDDEIQTKKRSKNDKVLHSEVEKNKPIKESQSTEKSKVDEQQRANDIFKNFLEEVKADMKKKENESVLERENTIMDTPESNPPDSGIKSGGSSFENSPVQPLCELFEFAGETVAVSVKDGTEITSTEISTTKNSDSKKNLEGNVPDVKPGNELPVKPKGLQSVLGTIMNKNKKLSVLDKTALDWHKFKREHGIAEELQTYNKGRGGFIERKRFLERSDVRSYEIERDLRMAKRKKN